MDLDAYREGEPEALAEVVDRAGPWVWALARRGFTCVDAITLGAERAPIWVLGASTPDEAAALTERVLTAALAPQRRAAARDRAEVDAQVHPPLACCAITFTMPVTGHAGEAWDLRESAPGKAEIQLYMKFDGYSPTALQRQVVRQELDGAARIYWNATDGAIRITAVHELSPFSSWDQTSISLSVRPLEERPEVHAIAAASR